LRFRAAVVALRGLPLSLQFRNQFAQQLHRAFGGVRPM
jgi:hypothetical protein